MCRVLDEVENRGIAKGIEQGIAKGVEQGVAKGIEALILDNIEEGFGREKIVGKVIKRFGVTEEKAEEYYEKYAVSSL